MISGQNPNLFAAYLLMVASLWCALMSEGMAMVRDEATGRELIVLAAPATDDAYYAEAAEAIFAFHVSFAAQIAEHDDVLILTDRAGADRYRQALGHDRVLVAPQLDIWARDYATSNAAAPIMFRYTAEGQGGGSRGQQDADAVQDALADLAEAAGLEFAETDLLNDGGNWVDDYAGSVVVSRKFLADNRLSEADARAVLRQETGAEHIAFIDADEQGGLEHADGVVAFVGPNTLIINRYGEDAAYATALRADLEAGLPGVEIHEIVTPYDGSEIYDSRFGSACGLYTNALVTPHRVYLPQFGIPEDQIALDQVRAATDRTVIPVPSGDVCAMGGGVRCMSWQLRGESARRLLAYARSQAG
jgi:agmatine/peptidylarginine deiminase